MHPATAAVLADLAAVGCIVDITVLPESAGTAALAAEQLGVPIGAIANSLVFEADGAPVLVMASGSHRVDTTLIQAMLGVGKVRRASPEFVRQHTGQAIGGVSPLGHPARLTTLVDEDLALHDVLWAAAGHPKAVFPTDYRTLLRITAGRAARVASSPA